MPKQPGGRRKDRPDLRGMDLSGIEALVGRLGEPKYRAKQIAAWVFQRGVSDFGEMTDLSKELRARLAEEVEICTVEISETSRSQSDGTAKLLLEHSCEPVYGAGRRSKLVTDRRDKSGFHATGFFGRQLCLS